MIVHGNSQIPYISANNVWDLGNESEALLYNKLKKKLRNVRGTIDIFGWL